MLCMEVVLILFSIVIVIVHMVLVQIIIVQVIINIVNTFEGAEYNTLT